jgi:hypothetical protein
MLETTVPVTREMILDAVSKKIDRARSESVKWETDNAEYIAIAGKNKNNLCARNPYKHAIEISFDNYAFIALAPPGHVFEVSKNEAAIFGLVDQDAYGNTDNPEDLPSASI